MIPDVLLITKFDNKNHFKALSLFLFKINQKYLIWNESNMKLIMQSFNMLFIFFFFGFFLSCVISCVTY